MGHKLFPGKISSFFIHGRVSLSPAPEPPSWGMLLLPWVHGEGWGLWTPLVPWFWSLGAVGGQKPPGTAPPYPGLCLHARLPAVYSPVPCLPGGSGCCTGTVPRGAQRVPLAPRWAAEASSSPWRGTVGGHRWPFSLSGFSKGYSPGWALCLLLLSDTNSCHGVGLGWDHAVELHTASWSWSVLVLGGGRWGCPSPLLPQAGLPHPGGLTVPNPPLGSKPGFVLLGGCGDAGSVPGPMVAVPTGLSWPLPLSFWGPGAAAAPPGSPAVRVWLGGVGLCRCRPRPGL